jgi:hypothetical protein
VGSSFEATGWVSRMSRPGESRPARLTKKEDRVYGQKLAEMARKHSGEAFSVIDASAGGSSVLRIGGTCEGDDRADDRLHTVEPT